MRPVSEMGNSIILSSQRARWHELSSWDINEVQLRLFQKFSYAAAGQMFETFNWSGFAFSVHGSVAFVRYVAEIPEWCKGVC